MEKVKIWTHGHIHSNSDYMIGDCRILCNPRGYVNTPNPKDLNAGFINPFIVKI